MSRESREELSSSLEHELRSQQNANERIDAAACELMRVNRTDGRCLDIIDQHERITAGDLAKAAGLSTGAVTAVLDRLEWGGHIRRVRDPYDRRRVYVEVTPDTLRHMHELWAPLAARLRQQLAGYSVEDLTMLRDWLRLGREVAVERADQLEALVQSAREGEGSVERMRRTAKAAKRDLKAAVGDVKLVAKEEKLRAKETAKRVKTELKQSLRGR